MRKKILVIANGAREHVIAETLKRSKEDIDIINFGEAKNPGLYQLSSRVEIGKLSDFNLLAKFVQREAPDFCVVGPEAPLANGITDFLLEYHLPTVGPSKNLARLESSKSFTRDLVDKYQIPGNPLFKVFTEINGVQEFLTELGDQFVIKYDGLKGGKGVKVAGDHLKNHEEAVAYAKECLEEAGRVVIEEKLIGQEFSLMSFCDGKTVIDLPAVQDHKRAYDNDEGPNTGGMGSYSDSDLSLPFLKPEDLKQAHEINQKIADALFKETGEYYKGILYGGFIVTKTGVKLIEYNVRFGDPEVMNVLPILKTDFVQICEAIIKGNLDQVKVEFEHKATVCKYAVPNGYPDNPVKGQKIEVFSAPKNAQFYFASVDKKPDGLYLVGSRAVAAVAMGETLEEAEKIVAEAITKIKGSVFYRKDIGTKELIGKKIKMMEEIRGQS